MRSPLLSSLRALAAVGGRVAPETTGRAAFGLFCLTPPRRPPSATARRIVADAEPLLVPFEGGTLRAWRWTTADSRSLRVAIERDLALIPAVAPRPIALLVHGWGGRAADLTPLASPLVAAGFDVVAFDGPGHGGSPGRSTNLPRMGAALLAVEEAVGVAAALVGHSFGGLIASYAAAGRFLPTRRSSAQRLAVIGAPNSAADLTRRFAATVGLADRSRRALDGRLLEVAGAPPEAFSTAAFVGAFGGQSLVVHDRDDREVPFADGEANGRHATHFLPTSGLGHRRILRDASVVERVVAFLQPLATAPALAA